MTMEQILDRVFELPTPARAFIAEKILETLDYEEDFPLSEEWLAEVKRRTREIDSGLIPMIPANRVFASIRDGLSA